MNDDVYLDNLTPEDFTKNFHHAEYQYEILVDSIKKFQDTLDEDSEVILMHTSFGKEVKMYVHNLGYSNPCLIHFYGWINGKESEIIQHISQLNFLITSGPKMEKDKPPRRIGFSISND